MQYRKCEETKVKNLSWPKLNILAPSNYWQQKTYQVGKGECVRYEKGETKVTPDIHMQQLGIET